MNKKELLFETAIRLFVERGFHATPTSEITKEAGVSAGILFHYFKTKEDLISQLYLSLKKEYINSILKDVDKFKAGRSKLRILWSNSWNWGISNILYFKYLNQIENSTYYTTLNKHPEIIELNKLFEDLLEEFINQRFIRNTNLKFLANSMSALTYSMVNQLAFQPDLKNDATFMEHAWDMFYSYFKP